MVALYVGTQLVFLMGNIVTVILQKGVCVLQVRGDQKEVIHQSHQRATKKGINKWARVPPAVAHVLLQPQRLLGEQLSVPFLFNYVLE